MFARLFLSAVLATATAATARPLLAQDEPAAEPTTVADEVRSLVETGLASDDVAVRSWALRAAAEYDDDAMRDALVAGLENVNVPVRIAAATALIEHDIETDAAEATLVAALLEGDAATRGLVLNRILIQLGEGVRERVLDAALDQVSDATVHRSLVDHIAQRGTGAVYDLLGRVTSIDDADTRAIYTGAVIRADRDEGVQIAAALLDARDMERKLEGAEIAFSINNLDARALLEELMDDADPALAQRIGFHLGQYGSPTALALARDLVMNPEMPEDLRMDAMALIRDNGAQLVSYDNIQTLLDEDGHSTAFVTRVHELMGATQAPEAIARLTELLDGMFADERLLGIAGMGYTAQTSSVDTLRGILSGAGDQMLRNAAADALGNLGGDVAAQALIDALRAERVPELRITIVDALGRTGSLLAPQPIANTLAMQEEELALTALSALRELGDASVASQIESAAVSFRSRPVRWKATVVLTHLDPELGRYRLLQALDRPPEDFMLDILELPQSVQDAVDDELLRHADTSIREAALLRVMRREDGGYAVLRPFAASATPDVRRQAIAVVAAKGDAEDLEAFQTLAQDTDRAIRVQGMAAIAQLADPEQEEFFRGYLNHADVTMRLIAAYALLRIADASAEG